MKELNTFREFLSEGKMDKFKVGQTVKYKADGKEKEGEIEKIDGIYLKLKDGGTIPYQSALNENESLSDLYLDQLQDAVGYKVAAPSYNPKGDKLVVYPDSDPSRDKFYDDRSSQRIGIKIIDGDFYIQSFFGYRRGIEPIAQQLGLKPGGSSLAGFSNLFPEGDGIKATPDQIKRLGKQLNKALKDEAKAQADFYKGWINPD